MGGDQTVPDSDCLRPTTRMTAPEPSRFPRRPNGTMFRSFGIARAATALLLVLSACATADGASSTTTTAPTDPLGLVAEFETPDGVTYRVQLVGDAADHARHAFEEGERPGIPLGKINPGDGGVNIGHQWHITEVEFADMAMEVCDGTAGYIDELGYEEFVEQHGEYFCPWGAELVALHGDS